MSTILGKIKTMCAATLVANTMLSPPSQAATTNISRAEISTPPAVCYITDIYKSSPATTTCIIYCVKDGIETEEQETLQAIFTDDEQEFRACTYATNKMSDAMTFGYPF